MRRVVAGINVTLDGVCDHTAMIADDEIHQHYTELLNNSTTLLYGRVTWNLMESYWPTLVEKPSGNKPEDDFAVAIQNIEKVVFSRTLESVGWKNAWLAKGDLAHEVIRLKETGTGDILVGSPGLIAALTNFKLIDQYQLCIQPTIAGTGRLLLENISDRTDLRLVGKKTFASTGSILLYHDVKR